VVVTVKYEAIEPIASDGHFDDILTEIESLTSTPVEVILNGETGTIDGDEISTWIDSVDTSDGPELVLDSEAAQAALESALADAGSGGGSAEFQVVSGDVRVVDSDGGTVCCSSDAGEDFVTNLLRGAPQPIAVNGRAATASEGLEEALALGVVERVARFQTEHPCCQSRVTNIQKMADIVRGSVIAPGGTFSLNDKVGRRTVEKGFVEGGFIKNGVLTTDIGGGVSQFATTLFNTAFFAGLDFVSAQAHSIYFSRYPYGREATVNWKQPDLVIKNNTPYGILIWTSYTNTSITVDMYSTEHMEVEQTGQTESTSGVCRNVNTERTRTYDDGRVDLDYFGARYRPEGLNCDGTPSDPSATTAPPATAPPETTTTIDPATTTTGTSTPAGPTTPTTAAPTTAAPTTAAPTTAAPTTAAPTTAAPTTAAPTTTEGP
jgi:vancomycin resistance protein YoaR